MQSKALAGLLAMPPPLRRLVLQAALPAPLHGATPYSTSSPAGGAPNALSYLLDAAGSASPSSSSSSSSSSSTRAPSTTLGPVPPASLLASASALFTDPPPRFLYSADRFRVLPVNTRIPEVCLLGRSNVGKSTLLNGLAGIAPRKAGHSHGPKGARAGLAITSARAGCTRTMNAYGFGPPLPRIPVPEVAGGDAAAAAAGDAAGAPSGQGGTGGTGGTTRAQRRAKGPPLEPPPRHSLIVMDLPGYGHNSQASWGAEIEKYLSRRAMLRGAVLLVDAVAGVKDGDRQALRLLAAADVRTVVVLTKADKLLLLDRGGPAAGEAELRRRCAQVREELERAAARAAARAPGGAAWDRWDRQVWVTGAGATDRAMAGEGGGLGVEGARLAVCQLARLVEQRQEGDGAAASVVVPRASAAPTGKIVPFDQIQWGASSTPAELPAEVRGPAAALQAEEPEAPRAPRGRARPWKKAAAATSGPAAGPRTTPVPRGLAGRASGAARDPFELAMAELSPQRRGHGRASF